MDVGGTTRDDNDLPLEEVLAAYLEEVDSGRSVDEVEWLERHPKYRDELSDFFRDHRIVELAVEQSSAGRSLSRPSSISGAGADPDVPSHRIGGYELIREIGRGGMGIVYEAHQPDLSRNVALKMLIGDRGASAEDRSRLRNEAESIARLDHPAIVAVHDMGSDRDRFWFTMQLIRGQNLSHQAYRYRADFHAAARVVVAIAEAIEHAHRRGVLHRDLKPGNILLDEEGRPHVSDFGLARHLDRDAALTQPGAILGTPSYLAPEQLTDPSGVTTAADIYGLGAILYFLLTGRPPIVANSVLEALDKVRNQTVAAPSRFNPNVPRDLDAICGRCLERLPEDRYESAGDVARDLSRWLEGKPVEARRITAWERLDRWRRRNPGVAGLVLCVIGLSVVLMVGSTAAALLLASANREVRNSLAEQVTAKQALQSERQATLRNLFEARKQQARAARFSGRPGQRTESIRAAKEAAALISQADLPPTAKLDLRNELIAALQLVDLVDEGPRLGGNRDPGSAVACRIAPDKRSLLITSVKTGETFSEAAIPKSWRVAGVAGIHLKFSPDGKYLASRVTAGGSNKILVWRVGVSEPWLASGTSSSSRYEESAHYAFHPDSGRVSFMVAGRLEVYRLADAERLFAKSLPGKISACFSHRSEELAVYGDESVLFLNAATGTRIRDLPIDQPIELAAWSPNDDLLAGVLNYRLPDSRDLHFWDAATGRHRKASGHVKKIDRFEFHPSGNIVATTSWDGSSRLWSVRDARELIRFDGQISRFSNDGSRLGVRTESGSRVMRLELPVEFSELAASTGRENRPIKAPEKMIGAAIHPDGRLMISGDFNGAVAWDLATNQGIAVANFNGADPRFSPYGKRLITVGANHREVFFQNVNKQEANNETVYLIGPPRRLQVGFQHGRFEDSASKSSLLPQACGARWFADKTPGQIFVYDMNRLQLTRVQGLRRSQNYPAVSRDGRLLAVHGPDTHVWNTKTGELVKTIDSSRARVAFSPDSRVLAVNESGRCTVYEVASWKPLYQSEATRIGSVAPPVAFSPDGSLLAYFPGYRRDVFLLSTDDFREIARIRLPAGSRLVDHLVFSPDGSQLIQCIGEINYRWDLRRLRARLGVLDWDTAPYPPPPSEMSKPIRLEFQEPSLVDRATQRLDELLWRAQWELELGTQALKGAIKKAEATVASQAPQRGP